MGETAKWDISVAPDAPHDLRKPHTLMRLALEGDHHQSPMRLRVDGRDANCTLESLYFRMLLLARFAGGTLNCKQIEIFDAWMWLWMPVLSGVRAPPAGAALRADLDSSRGLRRGPRDGDGPCLYLPQDPLDAAYRALVAEFHAGRIVPAKGIASEFRIEEHVAVLDLIRGGLRQSRREPVARPARRPAGRSVEVHVGLAEIMARGFATAAPVAALVAFDGQATSPARALRERDVAMGEIYEARRRMMHLADESDTGLGLEGAIAECGAIAAGDLVAVRLSRDEPLVIGKVARSVPSKSPGRAFLGVRRMSAAAQVLDVRREPVDRPAQDTAVVYVPGADSSGRHDACLVSERTFAQRSTIAAIADGMQFDFRLNRVRERGRGWVLAGFEVICARPYLEFEIA